MDRLSKGVSIITLKARIATELWSWMFTRSQESKKDATLVELVWTRLPYIVGHLIPIAEEVEERDRLAFQKAFFDTLGELSLEEMFATIPDSALAQLVTAPDITSALNRTKFETTVSTDTFEALYMQEVEAGITSYFTATWQRSGPDQWWFSPNHLESLQDVALNQLLAEFHDGRIGTQMPALRIMAGIVAAIRWDSDRRYKRGDWHDVLHASVALPYCDAFFTDRPLKTLLTTKPLVYDAVYGTKVMSEVEEILSFLQTL